MSEEKTIKLSNLDKFKVKCKNCKCEFDVDINYLKRGSSIYSCHICSEDFKIDEQDDVYERLKQLSYALKKLEKIEILIGV